MIVPIDLLKPILDDLLTLGRPNTPPRPWLGLYATEIEDKVDRGRARQDGPAQRADLRTGDVVVSVGGEDLNTLGRPLPQDLVARRRRRRSAADGLSRRQGLRRQGEVERPHPASQDAADALAIELSETVPQALLSSSAKADDPVRRNGADLARTAVTGCPAFAGHDTRRFLQSKSLICEIVKNHSPRIAGLRSRPINHAPCRVGR